MKRILDRVVSGAALAVTWPVIIGVGLAIKLDSPGPALFRAERLGTNGEIFKCNKFRTMKVDSEQKVSADYKTIVEDDDPRVTKLGRFFRHGIDELPQLLNVWCDEMSFVGPRPDAIWMWPKYGDTLKKRLSTHPGITGLGVVMDSRSLTTEEGYKIDIWYSDRRNLLLDFAIVTTTPLYILGFRNIWTPLRKRILKKLEFVTLLEEDGESDG